jgi:S1-C subfamily serine protease
MSNDAPRGDRAASPTTRRSLLATLAAAGTAGLAGCGGTGGSTTDGAATTDETGTTATPTAGVVTTEPASPSRTPEQVSIPPARGAELRDRVAQVGTAVRPAVTAIETGDTTTDVAGVFVRPSVVVTAASAVQSATPTVRTVDGRTVEGTRLGTTSPSEPGDDDIAAIRVEPPGPTLPRGSAAALTTGDVVIHIGHAFRFRDWVIQFGRVSEQSDGDQFRAFVPLPTPGGPVVTLDGALVGMTTGIVATDPPATDVPPPTEPPTVYTDRQQWLDVTHEPLADVEARVADWTG